MCILCFVLINSVLFNLLCDWILYERRSVTLSTVTKIPFWWSGACLCTYCSPIHLSITTPFQPLTSNVFCSVVNTTVKGVQVTWEKYKNISFQWGRGSHLSITASPFNNKIIIRTFSRLLFSAERAQRACSHIGTCTIYIYWHIYTQSHNTYYIPNKLC